MAAYWFCVKHHRVEETPGDVCPPIDRLGPYDTEAEAARALEKAQERNEEWDNDPNWSDQPGYDGQSKRRSPSDGPPAVATAPPPAPPRISPLPFAGMIGLACVLFLDLGTAGVLRWWAVGLLVVAWLVLFVLACAWWTPHPRRLPWLAVVGLALWVVVVVGVNVATR